ncbi:hypothetical protein CJU89_4760 [Yarrowia sp. B02]|nr:hypothetical protein CJU89_4760 [Yarrowia sp. B02]
MIWGLILLWASSAFSALGTRFAPPQDRTIEPTGHFRFFAVSVSWPCPWLTALVVPVEEKLWVAARVVPQITDSWFSFSEDYGFMRNDNSYLFLDPDAHSVTLVPSPHPEVTWRNGSVAYKVGGQEGNETYGASLAACPVEGRPFEYTVEYNSSCSGGHHIQLRAVGSGSLVTYWGDITRQNEAPEGSALDRKKAKRDLEGSEEFEQKLRRRLMGLEE